MAIATNLSAITLDCGDVGALAEFYRQLAGGTVSQSDDTYAGLSIPGGPTIAFQKVEDYKAPEWPGQKVPAQLHIDFAVEDLQAAADKLIALGADKPDFQPGKASWIILTDPAGHPFCLVPSS